MLGGQVTVFGLAVSPWAALGLILLVGLVAGYLVGALLSTRTILQASAQAKARREPAYLKGMRSMLARETDQAIAELTRAVELDSETVETYIALGHLYRSKGIFDRAIALRQSIIARPRLDPALRIQALYDLGVDYRLGGFISRAVETFQAVLEADPRHQAALGDLVQVQEELQDFDQALETQKRLDKVAGQERPAIWAQLKAERGRQLLKAGLVDQAQAAFKKALSWDKGCVEALLCLGDLHLAQGEVKKALAAWAKVAQAAPKLAFLALERATGQEWPAKDLEAVDEFILATASTSQDPWAQTLAARHLAVRGKEAETIMALRRLLEIAPGFLPAHRDLGLILLDRGQIDELLSAYKQLLERLPSKELEFECRQCGFRSGELTWKCPSCRQWGTLGPLP